MKLNLYFVEEICSTIRVVHVLLVRIYLPVKPFKTFDYPSWYSVLKHVAHSGNFLSGAYEQAPLVPSAYTDEKIIGTYPSLTFIQNIGYDCKYIQKFIVRLIQKQFNLRSF